MLGVKFPRASGILLHPTSLPGPFGIGDLGPAAYRFAHFLAGARQRLWQVLPLGPTGYGDSPYQCFSAFAGNPLLISLEKLAEEGVLSTRELKEVPSFPDHEVDYARVSKFKLAQLSKAFDNFKAQASAADREELDAFYRDNASWLNDYTFFMALKDCHGGAAWTEWESDVAARRPSAMARWCEKLGHEIQRHQYWQYQFFRQWAALKRYCHGQGIRIMGDIPIFVAHDSADVWACPGLFHLDANGNPTVVAGVPPDYFSATGQLWGNPLYRWEVMAENGYEWWVARLRAMLTLVDILRLDHFRGFEAYWEVPGTATTAIQGRWVKGPGMALFHAVCDALGELPIVAETLGVITPEVEALRERCGFPGMAVLQFAFGADPQARDFMPHNYHHHMVVYTGTHDNDTTLGWWSGNGADSTRTREQINRERAFALKYLATNGRDMNWVFIRTILASVADVAIIPLQDVLDLGSEARMNLPGRASGNWRWRFTPGMLKDENVERLTELTSIYGRQYQTP